MVGGGGGGVSISVSGSSSKKRTQVLDTYFIIHFALRVTLTYIFIVVKGVENIVREARQEVYQKPRFEIVHSYYLRVRHHLAAGPNEGRVEVEHDIDEEDHVHDRVHHQQRHVLRGLVLEGHVVGHHDGRVEGEEQDHPVPDGLTEGTKEGEDISKRKLIEYASSYTILQAM